MLQVNQTSDITNGLKENINVKSEFSQQTSNKVKVKWTMPE